MKSVEVNTSKAYNVLIGNGILGDSTFFSSVRLHDRTVMIVSDDTVFGLYGNLLIENLKNTSCNILTFVFPHGEQSKTIATYSELINIMSKNHMTRSDIIIALGGGVVGDIAGFAAATYLRGVDFIQIPTTLLAAVDSSVGGKTGVDLESGKNQVGAFYQPAQVLCDIDTLHTLPEDEYRNGCAEIIKYAMIGSKEMFLELQAHPVSQQYEDIIAKCVTMKRNIVEKDEFDRGERMLLNFGHTIGHAVETCSGYSVPHGQAVAIGMAMITRASVNMDICDNSVLSDLLMLLDQYQLPSVTSFDPKLLCEAMYCDKKSSGSGITLVVPKEIGNCYTLKIERDELPKWLKAGLGRL